MRITERMMSATVLRNLQDGASRLEHLQAALTSGKRLTRPSDDPQAVGRALDLRATLAANAQYTRNTDASLAWLQATDSSLGTATTLIQRARELAVQGANDALGPTQQQAIADELDQIAQQLVAVGNTSYQGQRLFAGLKTDADPFTLTAGPPTTLSYNGDSGQIVSEVDQGTSIGISVSGDRFLPALVSSVLSLRDNLRAGNVAAVRSSDLPAIDSARDALLGVRAEVGAKVNRLETIRDRRAQVDVQLQGLLSKAEDVDFAQAISELTLQQTVYQAGLEAGAKVLQPSLLDYLR